MVTLQASLIKLDNEEESEKIKHATGLRSKKKNNLCKCSTLFGIFLCHYRTINLKSNLTKTTLISELSWRLIMYRGNDKKEVGIADKMNQHISAQWIKK